MIDELAEILGQRPWHVAVIEYGITHGVMVIGIYHESYIHRFEWALGGVSYFRGSMMGGPYILSVVRPEQEIDDCQIQSDDGAFVVRFGHASRGRDHRKPRL